MADPATVSDAPAPGTALLPPPTPTASSKAREPAHFEDADGLFRTVCRASMTKKGCSRKDCAYVHDKALCRFFWKTGECKFGAACKRNHFVTIPAQKPEGESEADATDAEDATQSEAAAALKTKSNREKQNKSKVKKPPQKDEAAKAPKAKAVKGKNTEVFVPSSKPVDLRLTYDLGSAMDKFTTSLTSRDVLLAPNVFSDFKKGELYDKLLAELTNCGIPAEQLLKMWHGNDKIDGTHLIADDKTRWKTSCPTFQLVVDRLATFFSVKVQATRFNWYKDTSQWKPFHFDAAAVKPEIAAKQNFTIGVSFGATRDAAFEHAQTRTVVGVPQPDGCVYAFARDTNVIWRHGILQDTPVRPDGRISVIAWGWIDGMVDAPDTIEVAPVRDAKVRK